VGYTYYVHTVYYYNWHTRLEHARIIAYIILYNVIVVVVVVDVVIIIIISNVVRCVAVKRLRGRYRELFVYDKIIILLRYIIFFIDIVCISITTMRIIIIIIILKSADRVDSSAVHNIPSPTYTSIALFRNVRTR